MQLSTRMKVYESITKTKLMPRTPVIARFDGRSFTKYCTGLKKPFDEGLIEDMNSTAIALCKEIQGAKFAFIQSDEISLYLCDYDNYETNNWFGYELDKMCSIGASIATANFNFLRAKRDSSKFKLAQFDARFFNVPSKEEVINAFVFRQQDCTRNSIQMVAQSLYSPPEMHKKNTNILQEMIFQKGQNWNDYPVGQKRGRVVFKELYNIGGDKNPATRSRWTVVEPPIFTQDREFLGKFIPENV